MSLTVICPVMYDCWSFELFRFWHFMLVDDLNYQYATWIGVSMLVECLFSELNPFCSHWIYPSVGNGTWNLHVVQQQAQPALANRLPILEHRLCNSLALVKHPVQLDSHQRMKLITMSSDVPISLGEELCLPKGGHVNGCPAGLRAEEPTGKCKCNKAHKNFYITTLVVQAILAVTLKRYHFTSMNTSEFGEIVNKSGCSDMPR